MLAAWQARVVKDRARALACRGRLAYAGTRCRLTCSRRSPMPPQNHTPPAHPEELALLRGIVDHPGDDGRFLILADWLEEHDDQRRAELLRLHRRLLATCCEPDRH